jgi:hypothetical protein
MKMALSTGKNVTRVVFWAHAVADVLLGYAVDTNVRQIPTAVLNESQTQESRQLLAVRQFVRQDRG